MNKNLLIGIIVVFVIILTGLGIWLWFLQRADFVYEDNNLLTGVSDSGTSSQSQFLGQPDSISNINKDLDSIDLGNLDDDFKDVDNDINSL